MMEPDSHIPQGEGLSDTSRGVSDPSRVWACLCNPSDIRNIGGAIRAVANHGLAGLKVITHETLDQRSLFMYSSGSLEVISFRTFSTVEEALEESTVIYGTSRRDRDSLSPRLYSASDLPPLIAEHQNPHILFGNERTGLLTPELDLCQGMIEIPTSERFPSMNLSHAVACIGYELARPREDRSETSNTIEPPLSSSPKVSEAFYQRVIQVATQIDYPPGRTPEILARRLRAVLKRANPSPAEYGVILGLFRELHRLHQEQGEDPKSSHRADDSL
jgi:tRNA/rRNA methyltransferase